MPLIKSGKKEAVGQNIKEMMKSGYKSKQAIAASLSNQRKYKMMAEGGMVDDDLDSEHERSLYELMAQGDQMPVASPEVEKEQMSLASKLHEEHEAMEPYASGGLVEPMSGEEEPEVHAGVTSEPMSDEPMKPADVGHKVIDGVPALMGALSEEAKKAIMEKKRKRMFR